MSLAMNRLQEILAALVAIVLIAAEATLLYTGRPTDSFGSAIPVLIGFYFAAKVYQVASNPTPTSATVPVTSGTTTTLTTQSCDPTTAAAAAVAAPVAASSAAVVPNSEAPEAVTVSPVTIPVVSPDSVA